MIALDTNVVVRLIVQDDPEQTAIATALLDRAIADGAQMFVSSIVLCETVWVLGRSYKFPRARVADAISELLLATQLHVERTAHVESALSSFRSGAGDFPDYLIREVASAHGIEVLATFDRALLGEQGFVHPDPSRWPDGTSLRETPPAYGRRRGRQRRA